MSLAEPVVSLPATDASPWRRLLTRLAAAVGLLLFATIVAYLGRAGYRDLNETPIGFLDALYYSTVYSNPEVDCMQTNVQRANDLAPYYKF